MQLFFLLSYCVGKHTDGKELCMTLEEAKEFYFQYYGFSFHMDREEPARYNSFMMLELNPETLGQWDEELLEDLFSHFQDDPGRIWTRHETILKIISRNRCDSQYYMNRLLDEMAKMESLDLPNATLIIENMAGRTAAMKDGGAAVFFRLGGPVSRMNEIMEHMIETCRENNETDQRFAEAVHRYRQAYRKGLSK